MHKNFLIKYCQPLVEFAAACISVQCSLCLQAINRSHTNSESNIGYPGLLPLLCTQCLNLLNYSMHSGYSRCVKCAVLLPDKVENPGPLVLCVSCQSRSVAYSNVIAAFDYLPPGDMLIHKFKVQRQFWLACGLAGLMVTAVNNSGIRLPDDLIVVPVPSGPQAVLRRGFNPAAEIAKPFARYLGLTYKPGLLKRVHAGQKQAHLNREQRMISTAHLYGVHGCVLGAHIAVVDDVLTTGATLHNIARLFMRQGAASVSGFVLARTPT